MAALRKLHQVATSPLALPEKARYAWNARQGRIGGAYALEHHGTAWLRPGTTDGKVFDEVFIERIYQPFLAGLAPRTIVDLGANVGLSTLYLLRAFPDARAVAVEPDAGNLTALRRNLIVNGLAPRCTVLQAFAGGAPGFAQVQDSGNGAWGLRMGPPTASGIPVLPLEDIARQGGFGAISLLKCDIEGAERDLFAAIPHWDHLVEHIILELHADLYPLKEFHAALAASNYHWTLHGSTDALLSVIALERGAPKSEAKQATA